MNLFKTLLLLILLGNTSCKELKSKPNKEKIVENIIKENEYIIYENGVSDFLIGQKLTKSLEKYQIEKKVRKYESEGEAYKETYFSVSQNKIELLKYIIGGDFETGDEDIIINISIVSDKYRTDKNIGINSSIKDFAKEYPDFEIWFSYENNYFVIASSKFEGAFTFNTTDYIGNKDLYESDRVQVELSDFKEDAQIKSILFY